MNKSTHKVQSKAKQTMVYIIKFAILVCLAMVAANAKPKNKVLREKLKAPSQSSVNIQDKLDKFQYTMLILILSLDVSKGATNLQSCNHS